MREGPPEVADAVLVERTLRGDREAFGALVERYERVIAALARQRVSSAVEAEDVVQDAFLKAYGALRELREPARFGPWLYGIAQRTAIDHLRRRRRSGRIGSLDAARAEGGEEPVSPPDEGFAAIERRDESSKVLAAMGDLPPAYGVVLTLRYERQMSYKDIAEHLGEPPGTIANRLHRAVAMLKERLAAVAR